LADEPRWLSVDAVAALNREEAEALGAPHRIVDRAALEVAVKRPWNVWVYFMDRDLATLAMSLLVAVAGARAFAAANERTAYRAALALLEINGLTIDLGGSRERAEAQLFEYFRGRLSQAGVRAWFETWVTAADR
jgi:prophage maintenance system killer protein